MSVVVSLIDYRPSARFDETPWTQARLEGSTTETGTYTAIETFTLDPVDTDPARPARRSFTSEDVPDETEWLRIVWIDADGDQQPTEALAIDDAPGWRPSVEDIAGLLRARTKPRDGQEHLGTFTADTRPTDQEVRDLITQAVDQVAASFVSGTVPEGSWDAARQAALLRAAMWVETSYFPEEVEEGTGGILPSLRAQAAEARKTLIDGANARSLFGETS